MVLADGTRRSVPYVGPIELRLADRIGFTGALVMGDQALLGVVPMEDMDLVVVPKTQRVIPNPANPGLGGSAALSPMRPRGKNWSTYFASDTRASLPEREQPPLEKEGLEQGQPRNRQPPSV